MNAHARLPANAQERKSIPIATGCVDYFPDALAAVAELSKRGNDQHNPGQPLHWDRAKSTDEADALMRHFLERGTLDTDGVRHSAKVAWRALALLQKEIEGDAAKLKEVHGADFVFYAPTPQQAADDALREHQEERDENSRHGFTVGETVNCKHSKPGSTPGIVAGFGDYTDILVEFVLPFGPLDAYFPADTLRRGP